MAITPQSLQHGGGGSIAHYLQAGLENPRKSTGWNARSARGPL